MPRRIIVPDDFDDLREDYYEEIAYERPTNPTVLRTRIRKFLAEHDVTTSSFQNLIKVNSNSYGKFMNGTYKDKWRAMDNSTYTAADYFFWREKRLGKKRNIGGMMQAERGAFGASSAAARAPLTASNARVDPAAGMFPSSKPPSASLPMSSRVPAAAAASKPGALPDVSGIALEGTDKETWLTPAEVRREIDKMRATYKFSVAKLAAAAEYTRGTQPGQMISRFLGQGGNFGGHKMDCYDYLARFCEKMRIYEKRPKTEKRLMLEVDHVERLKKLERLGSVFMNDPRHRKPFLGIAENERVIMCPGMFFAKDHLGRTIVTSGFR